MTGAVRRPERIHLTTRPLVLVVAFALLAPLASASPPTNDHRVDAEALTLPAARSGVTTNATIQADESLPCGMGGKTVWYAFTPSVNGTVIVDTVGSGFDTVLAAYMSANSTPFTCNDDWSGLQSRIVIEAVEGLTYHIQLGSFGSGAGGPFEIHASDPANVPPSEVDLSVSNVRAEGRMLDGDVVSFRANLRNLGNGTGTTWFATEWYIDGQPVKRQTWAPGIPPGWNSTFYFSHVVFGVGLHTVEVRVDVDDNQTETNETNNAASATFEIVPAADIDVQVTEIRRAPLVTEVGDVRHPLARYEADVRVCNIGPVNATGVSLSYSIQGGSNESGSGPRSGSAQVGFDFPDVLGSGACFERTVRFDTPGTVGDFTFVASGSAFNDVSFGNNAGRASSFNLVGHEGGVVLPVAGARAS